MSDQVNCLRYPACTQDASPAANGPRDKFGRRFDNYGRRGLCVTCYDVARKLVQEGKTSWDDLVARGKALPSKSLKKRGEVIREWLLEEEK